MIQTSYIVLMLTPKKKQFIKEYIIDLNASQAAIRAGYSAKTAGEQGHRLLKDVQVSAGVAKAMAERSAKTNITAENVLKALALIAFADVRDVFDDKGNLKEPSKWSDEAAAAISAVEIVTSDKGSGEVYNVARIRHNDRLKALELLGKHMAMFVEVKADMTGDLAELILGARKRVTKVIDKKKD